MYVLIKIFFFLFILNHRFCYAGSLGGQINFIANQMDPDFFFVEADLESKESKMLNNQSAVYFVHPNSELDESKRTSVGIRALAKRYYLSTKVDSVLLSQHSLLKFNPYKRNSAVHWYYVASGEVDVTINSSSGDHNIFTPSLRNVVVTGGSYIYSVCEATQKIISGTFEDKKTGSLNIYFPIDALYGDARLSSPYQVTHDYFGNQNTLEEDLKNLGSKNFIRFVEHLFLGFSTNNPRGFAKMCPQQNHSLNPLDANSFKINFSINGKHIKSIGEGSKILNFSFIKVSDILESKVKL